MMPSTVIRSFHYNPEAQALDITFVSGLRYRYLAVPHETVEQFRKSFSKGEFFNHHIRDHFAFERLVIVSADPAR
jgi:hypothetical protein